MSQGPDLREAANSAANIAQLAAGPAVIAARDPVAEQKIRMQIVAGLSALSFAAMFTKTLVDDRLIARAIQKFSDPHFWSEFADDLWGE